MASRRATCRTISAGDERSSGPPSQVPRKPGSWLQYGRSQQPTRIEPFEPKAAFEASLVRRDELAEFAPVDGASLTRDLHHGLGEPAAALGILLCFARGGGPGRQLGCLGHRRGLARVVLAPRLEQGTELLAHRIATLDALP